MKDESGAIIVEGITIASGWKCRFCGLIRPWDRPECPKCPELGWADKRLRDAEAKDHQS